MSVKKEGTMFTGSIVALVTPWTKEGCLDLPNLEKLIHLHNQSGTQGLVVAGSTGEGLLLTQKERQQIIQTAVQLSTCPIIVGCGMPSTHETIRLGEEALSWGAHGLLVVAPYYVKPTANGMVKHFQIVCDALQQPIILYNNPGRCAVDMPVSAIADMADHNHVVGLKDSSTDLSRIASIKFALKRPIALLAGEDSCAADYLKSGGDGWISVVGNVAPALCRRVCDSKGQAVPTELHELIEALSVAGNPVAVKEALSYAERILHDVRLPLVPMDQPSKRLQNAVKACG